MIEAPKPEPEPVPVLAQEPVVEAPQVLSTSSPEFLKSRQAIADKLNHAMNTLPTDLQGVSYHEATEARYEETYQELKQELDQLRERYTLDMPQNDDHPLFGEYKKLSTYQDNMTLRVEALKKPQSDVVPKVVSPEDAAADDEFAKAARQATHQGFKGQIPK